MRRTSKNHLLDSGVNEIKYEETLEEIHSNPYERIATFREDLHRRHLLRPEHEGGRPMRSDRGAEIVHGCLFARARLKRSGGCLFACRPCSEVHADADV